jgi:hypothetical protein
VCLDAHFQEPSLVLLVLVDASLLPLYFTRL